MNSSIPKSPSHALEVPGPKLPMKRFLPICLGLVTFAFGARPNVLLICIDDLQPVLG